MGMEEIQWELDIKDQCNIAKDLAKAAIVTKADQLAKGTIGSSQGPIGSGESRIEISQGESAGTSYSGGSDRGTVSANAGTPGIPPGCPNPSGDNQCGEAPRQREIGQVYGSLQGWSENAQDPNDGLAVQCYGDNTAGVATQNTPNPNPSSGSC